MDDEKVGLTWSWFLLGSVTPIVFPSWSNWTHSRAPVLSSMLFWGLNLAKTWIPVPFFSFFFAGI